MSIRPLMTQQSARSLRLAAPARVLSWVGTLIPSSGEARKGSLVASAIETPTGRLNPKGQSPARQGSPNGCTAMNKKTIVKSWTGTETRIHAASNHGPWLSIALFLDSITADAAKRRGSLRRASGAASGAEVSVPPDGNHGVNKSWPTSTPGEFVR